MDYRNFDTEELNRIFADNGIDLENLEFEILSLVHGESFKNEGSIKIQFSEWDEPYPFIDPYKGAIEPALTHCLRNGWIKKITQEDILFEKGFYNEQIVNTFLPYRKGHLGLSYNGAQLYNKVCLLIDETCERRPYKCVTHEIDQGNKIFLYAYYEDTLLELLPIKMNYIYWSSMKKGKEPNITYVSPYKISSWCVRRFITLETGYCAEIHCEVLC